MFKRIAELAKQNFSRYLVYGYEYIFQQLLNEAGIS